MCKVVQVIGGSVLASEIEAIITHPKETKESKYGRIEIRTRSGKEFTYLNITDDNAYEFVREKAQELRIALQWDDIIQRP